ncbi:MAG: adenylate/guanylate cyclase domain-containing protein [Pseudomonadota bacterium]
MALKDDLISRVDQIFSDRWCQRNGNRIPDADSVRMANDAVIINAAVLYADMSDSTVLVDSRANWFAAEVYKSYLHCASRIIRSEGGEIASYDGDRVMGIFIGDAKCTSATRAALKINFARIHILNESLGKHYPDETYRVHHTVGVDRSELFAAKTGIRGSNDLVWVGTAANHAAKLCSLPNTHPTRITKEVYDFLPDSLKYSNEKPMWKKMTWNDNGRTIYRSTYGWRLK